MTVEELLKPRFEVIADYPNSGYEIGEIIECKKPLTDEEFVNAFLEYPHLFKKIQWWEKRQKHEMPKYLKHTLSEGDTSYHEVSNWNLSNPKFIEWNNADKSDFGDLGIWGADYNYMPCSQEEYMQFCNKV